MIRSGNPLFSCGVWGEFKELLVSWHFLTIYVCTPLPHPDRLGYIPTYTQPRVTSFHKRMPC